MKKIITILGGLLLAFAFVATVMAENTTVGNDATPRSVTDTRADFVVVDTNNPADHTGLLDNFEYYATVDKPFYFIVADDSSIVQWVSEAVDPTTVPGANTFEPAVKAPVEAGWNIGLYYPQTGVVPFDYAGDDRAYFTNAGWGMPTVGEQLVFQNLVQNRIYSYVAYYDEDIDDDGVLDVEDLCPNTNVDEWGDVDPILGVNRLMWNGNEWMTRNPKEKAIVSTNIEMNYTHGCSCEQILAKLVDKTGFDFDGHYKYGCSKSVIEDWIAGEYYLETVSIPSDETVASASSEIKPDETYILKASGTYIYGTWGVPYQADAKCSYRAPGVLNPNPYPIWLSGDDLPFPYTNYLEVRVNGGIVDWGVTSGQCNYTDNKYTMEYSGVDHLNFNIYDGGAIGDNHDIDLSVDIFVKLW